MEIAMSKEEIAEIAFYCGYTANDLGESCPQYDMSHEQYWFLHNFNDGIEESIHDNAMMERFEY